MGGILRNEAVSVKKNGKIAATCDIHPIFGGGRGIQIGVEKPPPHSSPPEPSRQTGDGMITTNRWLIAAAGVVTQMVLGTVYAWSVFKRPFMTAHHWSEMDAGRAFMMVISFLGLAAAFGGRFVDKAGAKKIATIAALLFGCGTLLTGLADQIGSKWLLWLGYGVIGGIGNGLGYITPIAVLVRWFPDKRGLITGTAVMGFGFGAAIMGKIGPAILPSLGLAVTFYICGAIYLILLLAAAQCLNNPPAGWKTPCPPAGAKIQAGSLPESRDIAGAVRMSQFYILWTIFFLNITAGISLISNLSPMAQDQVNLSATAAGTVVFISALFNGLGRIFWSAISDRLGRKTVFILILGTQIPLFLLLPRITSPILFGVIACYILSCYGGGFSTMPAYAADTFGAKHLGSIYGKILLAWSAAGVAGPLLMEIIKQTYGGFQQALFLAAGGLVLGFIIHLFYRKPGDAKTRNG